MKCIITNCADDEQQIDETDIEELKKLPDEQLNILGTQLAGGTRATKKVLNLVKKWQKEQDQLLILKETIHGNVNGMKSAQPELAARNKARIANQQAARKVKKQNQLALTLASPPSVRGLQFLSTLKPATAQLEGPSRFVLLPTLCTPPVLVPAQLSLPPIPSAAMQATSNNNSSFAFTSTGELAKLNASGALNFNTQGQIVVPISPSAPPPLLALTAQQPMLALPAPPAPESTPPCTPPCTPPGSPPKPTKKPQRKPKKEKAAKTKTPPRPIPPLSKKRAPAKKSEAQILQRIRKAVAAKRKKPIIM